MGKRASIINIINTLNSGVIFMSRNIEVEQNLGFITWRLADLHEKKEMVSRSIFNSHREFEMIQDEIDYLEKTYQEILKNNEGVVEYE